MTQEIILRGMQVGSDYDSDTEIRLWDLTPEQVKHVRTALLGDNTMAGCKIETTLGWVIRAKRASIENSLAEIAKVLQGGLLIRLGEDS